MLMSCELCFSKTLVIMLKGSQFLSRQTKCIFKADFFFRSKHSTEGLLQNTGVTTTFKNSEEYPPTQQLPLPSNIEDLASTEKLKFSPLRNRDINGSFISISKEVEEPKTEGTDDITEKYDCSGAINLSSAMQTNVPIPFKCKGKPTHLNMPNGQFRMSEKYTSDDLNNVHHSNQSEIQNGGTFPLGIKPKNKTSFLENGSPLLNSTNLWSSFDMTRYFSTKENFKVQESLDKIDPIKKTQGSIEKSSTQVPQLSRKEKLKAAVRDYGSVVIIFHVGISLISLGCCYLVVCSGVDLSNILAKWGMDEGAATAGAAAQFVVAYAIHKAMAPARIAITLTAVPFVVKKLRKAGVLKPPKAKPQ